MSSEKTATLEVARMALADIKPHPRNPRRHPKLDSPEWGAIRGSLERDYFDPLVVNTRNGQLVSGHLRHAVLLSLGYTHADVSIVDYDEETHVARLIAANTLLGEWEEELLATLASELESGGIPASLAGLTEKELASFVEGPTVVDDTATATELVSQAEDIQREWGVQLGDLYAAGEHRIFCGDCTSHASWRLLLGDRIADMVWTDPPYNVDYDSIQRRRIEIKAEQGKTSTQKPEEILNDSLSEAAYEKLLLAAFGAASAFTKPGGVIYVAHADSYGLLTRRALSAAGFYQAQTIIWVKNAFTLGRQDHQWQHEPILYGWKQGAAHYWQGGFSRSSVIDEEEKLDALSKPELIALCNRLRNDRDTTIVREPRGTGNTFHPTVKPLDLVARQIWNSSKRGDTVLELFGGSGTTVLAAEQTGRRAVATELEPKFCAVILERLKRHGLTVEKLSHEPPPTAATD